MRYVVQTFGCQMNVHDSRRIEEVLRAEGHAPAEDGSVADLVIVNTCSIREKAEHKLMSLLGTLRPWKESKRGAVLAVAGCVAQQEGERLLSKASFVDVVIGPDNIPELPRLIREASGGAPPVARTVFDDDDPRFLVARPRAEEPEVTAYVTVMKGCDERCTYCIVPHTRGAERYRSASEIVDEIARLVEGGIREVTLLGQTVNSWHPPDEEVASDPPDAEAELPSRFASTSRFSELLRRIADEVPALERLRYTSPHPRHVTPALVRAHAELEVMPAHVHLPVQSGSDRVLRRMLRRYTRSLYVDRAKALMDARPGLTLATDIIVGFPGETEEDFRETLSLVEEVGFVSAFCFKYSPRPYTPALKLGDDVPEEVKSDRLAWLFEAVEKNQRRHLDALVGTEQRVLVEGLTPHDKNGDGRFTGRTARNEIVHLLAPAALDPTGRVVDVRIDAANKHSLLGSMEGGVPTRRAPKSRVGLPILAGAT
jgi:tRNA-2-methylthio-N6-dimethylallyladenosine synthase